MELICFVVNPDEMPRFIQRVDLYLYYYYIKRYLICICFGIFINSIHFCSNSLSWDCDKLVSVSFLSLYRLLQGHRRPGFTNLVPGDTSYQHGPHELPVGMLKNAPFCRSVSKNSILSNFVKSSLIVTENSSTWSVSSHRSVWFIVMHYTTKKVSYFIDFSKVAALHLTQDPLGSSQVEKCWWLLLETHKRPNSRGCSDSRGFGILFHTHKHTQFLQALSHLHASKTHANATRIEFIPLFSCF